MERWEKYLCLEIEIDNNASETAKKRTMYSRSARELMLSKTQKKKKPFCSRRMRRGNGLGLCV